MTSYENYPMPKLERQLTENKWNIAKKNIKHNLLTDKKIKISTHYGHKRDTYYFIDSNYSRITVSINKN